MVEDRRRGAAQVGVAGEEVLVTMDADRSLVDDAGPDAVGSLGRLAPDRAGPQPPVPEGRIVGHRAATVNGTPFVVGQQDAASNATDGLVQPVQACLGGTDQRRDPFARESEFAFGEPSRRPALGRVEPVQHRGSPPGSGQRGSRGRVAVNRRVHPIGVADRISGRASSPPGGRPPFRPPCLFGCLRADVLSTETIETCAPGIRFHRSPASRLSSPRVRHQTAEPLAGRGARSCQQLDPANPHGHRGWQ